MSMDMYIEFDGHRRLDLSGRIDWATLCTRGFAEPHHMAALLIYFELSMQLFDQIQDVCASVLHCNFVAHCLSVVFVDSSQMQWIPS